MTNRQGRFRWQRILKGLFILGLFVPFLWPMASRASTLSQGFTTEQPLPLGTVVSLSPDKTDAVEPASTENEANILGVITSQEEGLITISSPENTVFVATSGAVATFVSDISGEIAVGDPIAASPIRGVGMKADDNSEFILGYALESFSGEANLKTETVSREDGSTMDARIGTIAVTLDPKAVKSGGTGDEAPLIFVGELIFGRQLSYVQLISSLLISLMVVVVVGSMLYGAIYSSIIAVGRNPLAKSLVHRDMIKSVLLSLVVVACGFGAVFLILSL